MTSVCKNMTITLDDISLSVISIQTPYIPCEVALIGFYRVAADHLTRGKDNGNHSKPRQ